MSNLSTAYLGLARKWRPQTFETLVGQSHIARTLINAIKTDRVSPAYLFTGTRGVGKTSAARLIAKAIRCQPSQRSGIACNICNDCLDITEGRSLDVQEIDGASNNGVDAVRELREHAKFLPSTGRYKIYIIDEVHMLTTAAFNALLKILEEPPAHLKFIFATTDVQKIPATILSRVQRFDFKRVSPHDLTTHVGNIAKAEGFSLDLAAMGILVREADGSLRDALSLLDQVIAAGETHITAEALALTLGLIDRRAILNTLSAVLKREPLAALTAAGEVHLYGADLKVFTRELLRTLRLLMVMQLMDQNGGQISALLEVTETDLADIKPLVGIRSNDDLDMIFCLLNNTLEDIARSLIPKTILDVLLIKMSAARELTSLSRFEPIKLETAEIKSAPSPIVAPVVALAPAPIATIAVQPVVTPPPLKTFGQSQWIETVSFVKAQKPMVGNILENVTFQSAAAAEGVLTLTLGFAKNQSFYKDQLQLKSNSDLLLTLLKTHLSSTVRLEYKEVLLSSSLEDAERNRKEALFKQRQKSILESEAVRAAQEVLGARLERLEIRGES